MAGTFAQNSRDADSTFPVLMNAEFHETNGGAAYGSCPPQPKPEFRSPNSMP